MQKLPWHWPIMQEVIRQHLSILLLLIGMGFIFSTIGGLGIWLTKDSSMYIFFGLFLLAGLAILVFGVMSNYTSCMYYYEQSLLKHYGKTVQAMVTLKTQLESIDQQNTTSTDDDVIETDLTVQYQFTLQGQNYEGESFISDITLFDAIEIGMHVPVLVIRDHPNISRLQTKKLKNQLRISNQVLTDQQAKIQVSEALIED